MAPIRRFTTSSISGPLSVKSVDLLKADNEPKHFTSDYECDELVVRRGFSFTLFITLSRDLNSGDRLEFELRFGGRPMTSRGSLIRLAKISKKVDEDLNTCKISAASGNNITLEINTAAASTGVGRWLLVMRPYRGRSSRAPIVPVTNDIIILFNAWSKADPVYMENNSWRNEYVLNENGMQFFGTSDSIGDMNWYFGQFEPPVIAACLKLLEMDGLLEKERGDPVMVSRHLSGMVNSNDDNGVLVGNWSGDYEDGKSPTYWNGSVAILKQFVDTNEPVKYGQCWVFSGVLTSVLRCLGIPARSLTTFESAHDTDGNLTIDYHYDHDGKPLDNDDSIWNFHVWNDAWMTRPLLPDGFGGWQAVDATPQEESDYKFQCGPASVAAIKEGQINFSYDAPFLYSEVNGSKVYWRKIAKPEAGDGGKLIEWEDIGSDTDLIGQHISTKAVGSYNREDITDSYKYPEGTQAERTSFHHARKFVKFTKVIRKDFVKVVEFQPNVPSSVSVGKDLHISVKIKNISKNPQIVNLNITGRSVQYNGSVIGELFNQKFQKEIPVSKTETFTITASAKQYLSVIRGNESIKLSLLGSVEGQRQTFATQKVVEFIKPKIAIEAKSPVRLFKPLKLKVSFTNPLSVTLDGAEFRFEGAGIKEAVVVSVPKVKANGIGTVEVSVIPRKIGLRRIIVSFSSKQLDGLRGSLDINVAA